MGYSEVLYTAMNINGKDTTKAYSCYKGEQINSSILKRVQPHPATMMLEVLSEQWCSGK